MANGEGENGAVDTGATVLMEDGEPVAAVIELPAGDAAPEPETPAEAVAIAEIEAARDVAVAEIQGETAVALEAERTAQIEAANEGERSWQEEAGELKANLTELRGLVDQLFSVLPSTPPPSPPEPEAEPVEEMEPVDPATISIPEFTSEETSEMPTEPIPESVEEKPEVPPAPARGRRRAI